MRGQPTATRALPLPRPAAQPSAQIARRVPRPQSLPMLDATGPGADGLEPDGRSEQRGVGRTDLGVISVADGVVAKLASRAAVEIADVGAAATRVLGREIPGSGLGGGLGKLGLKNSELGALPSCTAQVDGHLAFLSLTLSVRYPTSVRHAAAAVREQVIARVGQLTGLQIVEVDITVPSLVRDQPRPQRVH